ncbi:MAG: hypothetical protein HYZ20_20275, partial [Burkholderiales bacterium]|nr:hypothetical protein [Burkholderiales bacterium]
ALAAELAELRPLQDALGHWNDIVVARAHLAMRVALAQADAPGDAPPAASASEPGLAALHFAGGWLAREALAAEAGCVKASARWRRLPALAARPRLVRKTAKRAQPPAS